MTKKQIEEVRKHILTTAIQRKENRVSEEVSIKYISESEFFMGAYTCLTKMMSIIEDTTLDESMKYFHPAVIFSIMRNESIIDSMNKTTGEKK